MKTRWVVLTITVAASSLLSFSACAAERGGLAGGGPLQHILDAAKELNLTEDQRTKIQALAKELGAGHDPAAMKEKFKNDPAKMELLKEFKAARESGDEAKLKELRAKLFAGAGGEGAGKGEGIRDMFQKLRDILTPDQLAKLKEMREKNGERPGAGARSKEGDKGADNKSNKPDASKGVPVPFE